MCTFNHVVLIMFSSTLTNRLGLCLSYCNEQSLRIKAAARLTPIECRRLLVIVIIPGNKDSVELAPAADICPYTGDHGRSD